MEESETTKRKGQSEMAHIEIYTAWQMAKKLFPRRKILAAYYQSDKPA